MKKSLSLSFVALFVSAALYAQPATWAIDASHSAIRFSVTHLVISETEGKFNKFDGTLKAAQPDFSDAVIEFSADVKSVDTGNEQRDTHLKGADFFDADKFPKLSFKSTSMKKVSDGKYKVSGELTMKGVTKAVELDVTHNGTVKDPWGSTKAGFKLAGEINRFDYGLTWSKATETGGLVVGDKVRLNLNVELGKQVEKSQK